MRYYPPWDLGDLFPLLFDSESLYLTVKLRCYGVEALCMAQSPAPKIPSTSAIKLLPKMTMSVYIYLFSPLLLHTPGESTKTKTRPKPRPEPPKRHTCPSSPPLKQQHPLNSNHISGKAFSGNPFPVAAESKRLRNSARDLTYQSTI